MDTGGAGTTAPRDSGHWAEKVDRLSVGDDANRYGYAIDGRRVAGPQQGFGRLWQRTYTADLGTAVSPEALVTDWRAHFGSYWPKSGRFHGGVEAIQPGDVAPLTASGIVTGILVLYADETSFTFLTPEGHMFAAMITFSGERDGSGSTVAKISILLRCADPLFEVMWPVAKRGEDAFWSGTLRNLGVAHGVPTAAVVETTICVDRARLWKNWRNVRDNAGIRTVRHALGAPFRKTAKTA